MAFYYDFEKWIRDHPARAQGPGALDVQRVARNLIDLRASLDDAAGLNHVPPKTTHERLLIATWNIQHLGSTERYAESLFYLAEVLSRFDLIAIQEVKQELADLETIRSLLGDWWRYLVTDATTGDPGNEERLAYLYDSRKIRSGGLAGELVLESIEGEDGRPKPVRQIARTPLIAGFSSGWFRFMVATVHLVWGKGEQDEPIKVEEAQQVARRLADRLDEKGVWARNLFVLGDFNVFKPDGKAIEALEAAGFRIPVQRQHLRATNVGLEGRCYDQIAYRFADDPDLAPTRMGVVDPFEAVMSDAKFAHYRDEVRTSGGNVPSDPEGYYRTHFRRHQISDHLLLWAELPIEFADGYLVSRARGND